MQDNDSNKKKYEYPKTLTEGVEGYGVTIPEILLLSNTLNPIDKIVWCVLRKMIGLRRGAEPSIDLIVAQTHSSRSTIKRSIARLEEQGWLLVERRTTRPENTQPSIPNHYTPLLSNTRECNPTTGEVME